MVIAHDYVLRFNRKSDKLFRYSLLSLGLKERIFSLLQNEKISAIRSLTILSAFSEKPKFVFPDLMRNTKKELLAGDKFNLTCEAVGKPTPIVTWYKDSKIYERSGQRPGPYDYRLELKWLDVTDSGSYMCNVSNALGFLTFTYNLTVQG